MNCKENQQYLYRQRDINLIISILLIFNHTNLSIFFFFLSLLLSILFKLLFQSLDLSFLHSLSITNALLSLNYGKKREKKFLDKGGTHFLAFYCTLQCIFCDISLFRSISQPPSSTLAASEFNLMRRSASSLRVMQQQLCRKQCSISINFRLWVSGRKSQTKQMDTRDIAAKNQ